MNTLLIGYDLNKPGQHYSQLFERIKDISATWWHHLDSTWIIRSNLTAAEVRDDLASFDLDPNDELLVINVSNDAAAWRGFDQRGSTWLKDNL